MKKNFNLRELKKADLKKKNLIPLKLIQISLRKCFLIVCHNVPLVQMGIFDKQMQILRSCTFQHQEKFYDYFQIKELSVLKTTLQGSLTFSGNYLEKKIISYPLIFLVKSRQIFFLFSGFSPANRNLMNISTLWNYVCYIKDRYIVF